MEISQHIESVRVLSSEAPLENVSFLLSFRNFLNKLKTKLQKDTKKSAFDILWLGELEKHEEWLDDEHSENRVTGEALFEFVQHSLFAPAQAKDLMWGLIQPVYPYCIYSTPALRGLLEQDFQVRLKPGVFIDSRIRAHDVWRMVFYSFILQKVYGFSVSNHMSFVARIGDIEKELVKYFRFDIDTTFLEVSILDELPDLKIEDVSEYDAQGLLFDYLEQVLPLTIFSLSGFASVKVTKDTTQCILEEVRAAIINQTTVSIVDTTKMVLKMLSSLVQSNNIQFGLLPFLTLNGKPINFDLARQLSLVLNTSFAKSISSQDILKSLEKYNNDPKLVVGDKTAGIDNRLLQGILDEGHFQKIALLPIYHQSRLVGHLEIATTSNRELTKQINVFALEQAMPFLAELVYRDNMEFNNQIGQIVQSKFTSIHPSVLWKLNESAFGYLRDLISKPQQAVLSQVVFERVYPLYGVVDIRNSTAIRNKAIRDDLTIQLVNLTATLKQMNAQLQLKTVDAKIKSCLSWLDILKVNCTAEIELNIYSFIDSEVNPLLIYYKNASLQISDCVHKYYEIIRPQKGLSDANRREIEQSIHVINDRINTCIESFSSSLQRCFPSYFDSFRTDGVEYDIYLGQSIAPDKHFDDHHIHEYRLLQLLSMAEIARQTHAASTQMKVPLHTTQLIFTSNRPIDISFRSDEKRFDVEGSYNIRYQTIKKRIDKVYIKGTHERLTQPGKIAIVYLEEELKQEYAKYVLYGQQQGYFKEQVEYLQLQELQDVSGLKAMRVAIKL